MNTLALSLLSICLYSFGTGYQLLIYRRKLPSKAFVSLLIGILALTSQSIVTVDNIVGESHLNLGFTNSASLIACLVVTCLLIWSLRKPIQSTLLAVYPIAALTVLGTLLIEDNQATFSPSNTGIFIHIILSIIAYSVFSIAAIQAVLIYIQNNNLKKKNHTILMRNLPPLLTMENLLFEMLWSGTVLLALAITAGAIFIEDIFAQHLVHKTFFSILSFLVFAMLLLGRAKYGWRGAVASKWTLWGCALLMLGFFGSKFVLELIGS